MKSFKLDMTHHCGALRPPGTMKLPGPPWITGNYMNVWAQGWPCRVLNMWFENIVASCIKFTTDNIVNVRYWENTGNPIPGVLLIDDDRIPRNYYIDGLTLHGLQLNHQVQKEIEEFRKGK